MNNTSSGGSFENSLKNVRATPCTIEASKVVLNVTELHIPWMTKNIYHINQKLMKTV